MRAQNSLQMLAGHDKFSLAQLTQLKLSTRSLLADRTLPDLLAAAKAVPASDTASDTDMQAAAKLLADWNHDYDSSNRAGLLFEEWARLFAGRYFGDESGYAQPFDPARATTTPTGLRDSAAALGLLRQAITITKAKYDAIDRVYGEVSRFRIDGVDLPGDGNAGGLGPVRVITWTAPDAKGHRTPIHGETWVALIEFSTPIKAYGLMSYGNARQPGTKHHSDQLEMLAKHQLRELWLQRSQVEAHAEEVTVLGP
jgi:acyl-homoserine-lactone acylase